MPVPNFGWELPPGVTHKMIDDQMREDEDNDCIDCETETLIRREKSKCKECGDTLCTSCYEDQHRMCRTCLADV
jgi:ribosomal protein L37AE/L43A